MTSEPCRIVERPAGLFWFQAQATLASALTPEQAYARLQQGPAADCRSAGCWDVADHPACVYRMRAGRFLLTVRPLG